LLLQSRDSDSHEQALIVASELECALHDANHPAAQLCSLLTDQIAQKHDAFSQLSAVEQAELPETVTLNTPEGFAFYALPIRGYLEVVTRVVRGKPAAVVGIRSAGVAHSAITATDRGSRITVRPSGHPYDRELTLNQEQLAWVQRMVAQGREFFIVDEGPGLSGSSFLATAEALEAAAVPIKRIHLIGSNQCDPDRLVARNAGERWRRFDFHVVPASGPPTATRYFAHGDWRSEFLIDDDSWPATWTQLTPPKYIAEDGNSILKFEGLGSHGQLAFARAQSLAHHGYAPPLIGRSGGFVAYTRVSGESLSRHDLDEAVIHRIAEYVAFRRSDFAYEYAERSELELMAVHNVRQLLGIELHDFHLPMEQPVVCDARMMPHEWIRAADHSRIFKVDGTTHGDNHFFPGPCDIAWDIAGAIVEWKMSPQTSARFIEAYECESGDRVRKRLNPYMIAYPAFHAAYAKMAWNSINNAAEKMRFEREFDRYISDLKRALGTGVPTAAGQSV
jgi:hypothetical protein